MKIREIKVIVASPGRNFVTVKIVTDEGLHGVGDATVNGREKAVVAYLEDHVIPILIGKDPTRIEDIWQYLYKGAYWRRGPITMAAISGIDMALWDIKAKAADMPLYQLLGGASRDRMMVYQHVGGLDIEEVVEGVLAKREAGLEAIRAQVSIPGLPPIYGTGKGLQPGYGRHGPGRSDRGGLGHAQISAADPETLRAAPRRGRMGRPPPPRRPPPADADRGRASRQGSRTLPPLLAGGRGPGRASGRLPPDPAAHHDPARGRARSSTPSGTASS